MNKLLALCTLCLPAAGCVSFAPPPPLATLGGPATTARGVSELGIAVGGGAAEFIGSDGGFGALGRYRYGVTDKFDLGIDAVYADYEHGHALTAKLAGRYQLAHNWRLELGVGSADASEGTSLHTDLGITWGTRDASRSWNQYATLRFAAAKDHENDDFDKEERLADAYFGVLSYGLQKDLGHDRRFVVEAGLGGMYLDAPADRPEDDDDHALYYLTVALLFDVGGSR